MAAADEGARIIKRLHRRDILAQDEWQLYGRFKTASDRLSYEGDRSLISDGARLFRVVRLLGILRRFWRRQADFFKAPFGARRMTKKAGAPMTSVRGIASRVTSVVVAAGLAAGQLISVASAQQPIDQHHKGQRNGQPRQAAPQPQARPTPTPQARPTPAPQAARPAPQPQAARQAPPLVFSRSAPPPVARSGPPPRYEVGRRHERDRRYDRGIAIGVGAAIIGATLGYRYYRGPDRDSVYDRCDRNFPEFDYDTGTFTNEDGDRELCPYLSRYLD
jgi:hypothetical protein